MAGRRLPPAAAVVSFVDAVNRGDIAALGALMTDDHELRVFDEMPVTGRDANVTAWRGYLTAFPEYVIYPREIVEVGPDGETAPRNGTVAVLGHTTGSHLGLPDEQERAQTLIWTAAVTDGLVRAWTLVPDTPEIRRKLGFAQ